MGEQPLHEKGGELSTILGVQCLWIGPLYCLLGVSSFQWDVHLLLEAISSEPFLEVFLNMPNFYMSYSSGFPMPAPMLPFGMMFTVWGLLAVRHWLKLYRQDLLWERKLGYDDG